MNAEDSKPKLQARLALVTIAIGVVLMVGKIYADSEPGAIPLFLVVTGIAWYSVTRFRRRAGRVE